MTRRPRQTPTGDPVTKVGAPARLGDKLARAALVVALVAGTAACGGGSRDGAGGPGRDSVGEPSAIWRSGGVEFTTVAVEVSPGDGMASVQAALCALLADTDAERARGLMEVEDLDGYDGMLFRFADDTTARFHMADTRIPLSIAWFDAAGHFVSSAEMPPCPDGEECPTYGPDRPYRLALEVPAGDLADMGIGPGSRISAGGTCRR